MTTFYSPHYGPAIGETGHFTTLSAPVPAVSVGVKHSRQRRTAALLTVPSAQDLGNGDIIRLFDLSSNDRLIHLYFSMDGNWGATTTFNVGLYEKGAQNDGAVIDVNLFAAADNWAATLAREDLFKQATTLDDWDRGKQLWELANIGLAASTYSAETGALWTVAATTSQDIDATDNAVEFLVEAFYVAGD